MKPAPYFGQAFNASHRGTDIFAPRNTDVYAVDDGRVRFDYDLKGGVVAYVESSSGKYYYAHLADTVGEPRAVKTGDVIGKVGNSGNAAGKATHLHFQVSLPGTGTVDPFPLLAELHPRGVVNEAAKPVPLALSSFGLALCIC